jgi:hypothetical protein
MSKGIVISLYDYTGEALKPWAMNGYTCYAFDIQHPVDEIQIDKYESGGLIRYVHADLHDFNTHKAIFNTFNGKRVMFGMAFPVCTDLAVSGAAHFKRKAERDPHFQDKAAKHASDCAELFEDLGCPYFVENPVSVLATKWRKPDYIAPKDAYTKKTCLWTGNDFEMPQPRPTQTPDGYSTQHLKLGGKSKRTKDIRSATPRGFATAVYEYNRPIPSADPYRAAYYMEEELV